MKVKIKEITEGCMPEIIKVGDWIDLYLAEDVKMKKGEFTLASLGIAVELPKGTEAIINPRSSTYKNYFVTIANSQGVIDNSYCGEEDIWKAPLLCHKITEIPKGARICQFRVQLSQQATFWQRIKWLFNGKIKLIKVDSLTGKSRSGFGSTGL